MYILFYIKIGYQALRYIKMTKAKARPNIIFEIVYIFRTKMILKFIGARARFELKTLGSKLLFPRLFLINSLKTECDLKSIKNFIFMEHFKQESSQDRYQVSKQFINSHLSITNSKVFDLSRKTT